MAAPIAALLFMALAMIEQRETFVQLFGVRPDRSASAQDTLALRRGAARAEAAVAALNHALQQAHQRGDPRPLTVLPLGDALRQELVRIVRFARERGEGPVRLDRSQVLLVEPGPSESWRVQTEEVWTTRAGSTDSSGGQSRLRFRYELVSGDDRQLVIERMIPLLPEPDREARP